MRFNLFDKRPHTVLVEAFSSTLILREYTVKEHIHTSKIKGYLV